MHIEGKGDYVVRQYESRMSGEEKSDKDALGESGVFSDPRRLGGCSEASTVT